MPKAITETLVSPPAGAEHSPAPQPERAIYGFFLLFSSVIAFIVYVLVSYMPEQAAAHFNYLPDKYWSIALPAQLICVVVAIVPLYIAMNMMSVCEPYSTSSIRDKYSLRKKTECARCDKETSTTTMKIATGIDPVYDIPLTDICQYLYIPANQ